MSTIPRMFTAVTLLMVVALVIDGSTPSRGSDPPTSSTVESKLVSDCGNAFYDDGTAEDTDWFYGEGAGDPDKMFAVKFVLADFGRTPGNTQITSFCAANQMDWGGPWPNEVFIYPAGPGGMPDDSTVLGQGTIYTGDGQGWYEVTLVAPVILTGDFWLVNRGDPAWVGEDFNMDFDSSSDAGQSYISSSGIAGLESTTVGNYMLRATLETVLPDGGIFLDGFESGDTTAWSDSVP